MIRVMFPLVLAAALLTGCATNPHQSLPVRLGTVIETQQGLRPEFQPSTGGAVVGGVAGGLIGSQIGKGSGKKWATAIGVVGGAAEPAFKGSGEITSLALADGYIEIPAQTDIVESGEMVHVKLF